jgi:hypothetical protein
MRKRKQKSAGSEDTKIKHEPSVNINTFNPVERAGPKEPVIPSIPVEQPRKKWILSKMTDEEKELLNARNEWIKEQRRKESIEKILKEIGSNKYSPFIGKKLNIRGELCEVKERKS